MKNERNVEHKSTTVNWVELAVILDKTTLVSGTIGVTMSCILKSCTNHHSSGLFGFGIGSMGVLHGLVTSITPCLSRGNVLLLLLIIVSLFGERAVGYMVKKIFLVLV